MDDLESLTPKYTTIIREGYYMWRTTSDIAHHLLEKIKRIDGTLEILQ